MHSTFYNQATFELTLQPDTPLLIKAGNTGLTAIDPILPDMSFVRTRRANRDPEVYIPGSSLRGVVRAYAERLLRSLDPVSACNPTQTRGGDANQTKACFAGEKDTTKLSGVEAYNGSCRACRLFGNTALASRVRFADLYLTEQSPGPALETRYGVAIDRVTGAVAQGPFELETLTEAQFGGNLVIRNFTVSQLGLLAAALLDLSDGLVPLGFGKSKGLGRVKLGFQKLTVRTVKAAEGKLLGVGALHGERENGYRLPAGDELDWTGSPQRVRGFFEGGLEGDAAIRPLLETVAGRWPQELGA